MDTLSVKFWEVLNGENIIERSEELQEVVNDVVVIPETLKDHILQSVRDFLSSRGWNRWPDWFYVNINYRRIPQTIRKYDVTSKVVQGVYLPVTTSELSKLMTSRNESIFHVMTNSPILSLAPEHALPHSIIETFSLLARDFYLQYRKDVEFRVSRDIYHKLKAHHDVHPFKVEYYESLNPNHILCVVNET